jgi:hypothetical protein
MIGVDQNEFDKSDLAKGGKGLGKVVRNVTVK